MSPTSPVNAAAVLILQQANAALASPEKTRPAGDGLLAAANGLPGALESSKPSAQAQAKVNEALFSTTVVDLHQLKINLMQRLGLAFGVNLEDYKSAAEFGGVIRGLVAEIKNQENGALQLREIEKKLGLDTLGISLDTLVNAIIDPEGSDGEKLDAALKKKLGIEDKDDGKEAYRGAPAGARTDETGLYGL
jgi:hypothetical protein